MLKYLEAYVSCFISGEERSYVSHQLSERKVYYGTALLYLFINNKENHKYIIQTSIYLGYINIIVVNSTFDVKNY